MRIEVQDMGGPWRTRSQDDRPHGLDIVEALTGPDDRQRGFTTGELTRLAAISGISPW